MSFSRGDAQDHGYAFVVLLASFVTQVLVFGVIWTVGVFYVIFVDVFPESRGAVAAVSSLNTAFAYGIAPVASFLLNKFGCRTLTIVGGLLGSLGLVLSMYATNVYVLYVTYGVITGAGLGLAYLPSITIIGDYFDKWRPLAMGICASGVGAGQFTHAPLIRYFLHQYGWRGSLLMIAGVTLNICVCGAFFKPFRKPTESSHAVKDHNSINKSPVSETGKPTEKLLSKSELGNSVDSFKVSKEKKNIHCSVESLVSHFIAEKTYGNEIVPVDDLKKHNLLNCFIFENYSYLILCLNNIGICFGTSIVLVHLAAYSSTFEIDEDKSAMLYTVIGLANLFGRIMFGILAQMKFVTALTLYTAAFLITGIATCVCPLYSSYAWFIGYAALYGIFTGCFGSLLPTIMIDLLELQYLSSAYGYLLIFEALGALLGAPAAGWLYDWTGIYSYSFYLAGSVLIITTSLLVVPIVFNNVKSCQRKKSEEQYITVVDKNPDV